MFEALIEALVEYVRQFGGIGVLLGVLLESFIAPIPSPLIPASAGFILVSSNATVYEAFAACFVTIALWGSLGATIGAFFGYAIGYYGGRPLIAKYGKYLGITQEDLDKIEARLGRKHTKAAVLFLSRVIPVVPLSPISFFAGLIHFNTIKFAALTFAGALPRYFVLGLVGWWAGVAYTELVETLGFFESVVLVFILIGVVIILVFYKLRRK